MVRCWLALACSWCWAGFLVTGRRDPHDPDTSTQVLKPVVVRVVDGAARKFGVSAVLVNCQCLLPVLSSPVAGAHRSCAPTDCEYSKR